MENYICFATLSTGSKIKLTEPDYENFLEASNDDFIQLASGTTFKKAAVMAIQGIDEWVDDQKDYDYHQPFTALPVGQDRGFKGIIDLATDATHIEALARGLKKAKAKFEAKRQTTKNIDEWLHKCQLQYAKIKSGFYKTN